MPARAWFQCFRNMFGVYNVRMSRKVANVDVDSAKKFQDELDKMISDEKYQ